MKVDVVDDSRDRVDAGQADALLRWHTVKQDFMPGEAEGELWLIDSWLVDEGRIRALSAHFARFRAPCMQLAPDLADEIDAFFIAVARNLPTRGRWFPRIELALVNCEPQLRLWLRPAPPRGRTVRLWVAPEPDRRLHPTVKGLDLTYLIRLRQTAIEHGADEAVLLSSSGTLLEGSMSSLLWWQGNTLCAPPGDSLLPGITRAVLFDLARADGLGTHQTMSARPEDLAGRETWIVNALHGIRPVVDWGGLSMTTGAPTRAACWNARLDRLAMSVETRGRLFDEERGTNPDYAGATVRLTEPEAHCVVKNGT
jgi:branched-subunit amino acid aminotransferase/4-amino-4-deoxychorismate lyase